MTKYKDSESEKAEYDFQLDLKLQYDFNPKWSLYSPINMTYVGKQMNESETIKIKSYLTYSVGLGAKYAIFDHSNIYFAAQYMVAPSVTIETAVPLTLSGNASGFSFNLGRNIKI